MHERFVKQGLCLNEKLTNHLKLGMSIDIKFHIDIGGDHIDTE